MSCHESPLKQTDSLERRKEGGRRDVYAEDTNTSSRGSGAAGGGGVRGRDEQQLKCLGVNENDGWCGICRKVCARSQSRINHLLQQQQQQERARVNFHFVKPHYVRKATDPSH